MISFLTPKSSNRGHCNGVTRSMAGSDEKRGTGVVRKTERRDDVKDVEIDVSIKLKYVVLNK